MAGIPPPKQSDTNERASVVQTKGRCACNYVRSSHCSRIIPQMHGVREMVRVVPDQNAMHDRLATNNLHQEYLPRIIDGYSKYHTSISFDYMQLLYPPGDLSAYQICGSERKVPRHPLYHDIRIDPSNSALYRRCEDLDFLRITQTSPEEAVCMYPYPALFEDTQSPND